MEGGGKPLMEYLALALDIGNWEIFMMIVQNIFIASKAMTAHCARLKTYKDDQVAVNLSAAVTGSESETQSILLAHSKQHLASSQIIHMRRKFKQYIHCLKYCTTNLKPGK